MNILINLTKHHPLISLDNILFEFNKTYNKNISENQNC